MAFCQKCGEKLDEGVLVCPKCGAAVAVGRAPKSNKKLFIILGIVVALIIIAVAVFLIVGAKKKEINLTQYIEVQFDGANASGTATVEFDDTEFKIALLEANGMDVKHYIELDDGNYDKDDIFAIFGTENEYKLLESVKVELSKDGKLSNGDVITATITYDESLAKACDVVLQKPEASYTVEGLNEMAE